MIGNRGQLGPSASGDRGGLSFKQPQLCLFVYRFLGRHGRDVGRQIDFKRWIELVPKHGLQTESRNRAHDSSRNKEGGSEQVAIVLAESAAQGYRKSRRMPTGNRRPEETAIPLDARHTNGPLILALKKRHAKANVGEPCADHRHPIRNTTTKHNNGSLPSCSSTKTRTSSGVRESCTGSATPTRARPTTLIPRPLCSSATTSTTSATRSRPS